MSILRVLAIIGNTIMLVGYTYLFIAKDLSGALLAVYIPLALVPLISLMYLYKKRFYKFSELDQIKAKEKQGSFLSLWIQRKKLEEQVKINNLKKD
ncbi:hypothetical protein O9402_08255 [Proteus mirabilis]|uniref:hypothetical protein n=1 Tax=Proteus mirabilis TaxID=584 RepID=UPI002575BC35|nr:hypothetical protein [Proteus mirabilis]MDM3724342.1 hypothetical protein [Proteus mirabilis]